MPNNGQCQPSYIADGVSVLSFVGGGGRGRMGVYMGCAMPVPAGYATRMARLWAEMFGRQGKLALRCGRGASHVKQFQSTLHCASTCAQ